MPKKYGVKEKDLVVAHVVNLILTGKLRSGDRVDRNELAHELGVSRVPIQEAVVQLEHDGILSTQYHRGAYVETFDESVVREHHHIYGMLSGVASARAAEIRDPAHLHQLSTLLDTMRANVDSRAFQEPAFQFRVLINEEYSGPRLLAMIRGSQSFLPRAFWSAYQDNHRDLLRFLEADFDAIRAGDCAAARAANDGRAALMAQIMLTELVRRGVLPAAGATRVDF
jgi:DNA-binding GntR family transcriptional regulator